MNEVLARKNLGNKTRLSYWFSQIPSDILVPNTEIVFYDRDNLINLLDGQMPIGFRSLCDKLIGIGNRLGWPLFLRTDYLSGKHNWENTCYVSSSRDIPSHVIRLVEESALADMLGFPTDCWIVREIIPTSATFTAFRGDMPIVKERRYFVQDDKVICHHPYWPSTVFNETRVSIEDWKKHLDIINLESNDEIRLLSNLSSKVGAAVTGAWSIDWLWSEQRGQWFLIDMAEAKSSYHWPGCLKYREMIEDVSR